MALDHVLQDIPYYRLFLIYDTLGRFDCLDNPALYELANDKRLVKLSGHILRQTTFEEFELWPYDNHRTSGVIHTLTKEVLTEASLFTFERVRKGLERTIGIGLYSRGFAGIIKEGIYGFLQHTFFVAQNHIRRFDFYQALETIVANDHTAIEVIEVGGSKTPSVQRHKRTQFGRDHRNDLHDHPFGEVLPVLLRITESLHYL